MKFRQLFVAGLFSLSLIPSVQAELSARWYVEKGNKKLEIINKYDNLKIKDVLVNRGNCYSLSSRQKQITKAYHYLKNNPDSQLSFNPFAMIASQLEGNAENAQLSQDITTIRVLEAFGGYDSLEKILDVYFDNATKTRSFGDTVTLDLENFCNSILEVTVISNKGKDVLEFNR